MIQLDYWDAALFASVFLLYYTWPAIVPIDAYIIYQIIKCIKQRQYKRMLFFTPVVVIISGSLVFILIIWLQG